MPINISKEDYQKISSKNGENMGENAECKKLQKEPNELEELINKLEELSKQEVENEI